MKLLQHNKKTSVANNPSGFFQKGSSNTFFGKNNKPFFNTIPVQAKLTINQPNDPFEKEADAMADNVVRRMSNTDSADPIPNTNSFFSHSILPVQRKCAACEEEEKLQKKEKGEGESLTGHLQKKSIFESNAEPAEEDNGIQRKCSSCEKEEKKTGLLSKAVGEPDPLEYYGNQMLGEAGTAPKQEEKEETAVQKKGQEGHADGMDHFGSKLSTALNFGGSPMPAPVQNSMQKSFGSDFNQVRIHDNPESYALNDQVNAKAFTHRNHIFFNKNEYKPGSLQGKHLLAHELTHTIQQSGGKPVSIQRKMGDGHDFPPASRFSGNLVLEDVFDNRRVVSSGSNGAHVTLIQQVLIARNYLLPTFGVDGIFGNETERAVRAFQQDVGLKVDGIVGFRTIDFLDKRDRNAEVTPPVRPVIANTPFNANNAIVQPGATPSRALTPCQYGLTFPENVQVRIDLVNNAGIWQPVLREVVGNYSLQARRVAGQAEVTGPAGNTTSANYCAQITELNALGHCPGGGPGAAPPAAFYMLSAVLAHERVHATKFRTALIHPSVITALETAIEGITRPATGLSANPLFAELFIRFDPAFSAALTAARTNWLRRILVLVAGDHAAGGPTDRAEHGVVDPMVRRICTHARANGWPACPPLCR